MPEFSNYHHQIADNLKFLYGALGLDELFRRLHVLDNKGEGPEDAPFNPTNNPMVQRNMEGIGTLSGGPDEENTSGRLDVLEPERMERIRAEAEAAEPAEEVTEEPAVPEAETEQDKIEARQEDDSPPVNATEAAEEWDGIPRTSPAYEETVTKEETQSGDNLRSE
jgi:hypothetical protein